MEETYKERAEDIATEYR